jgi:hypothetical protein
MADHGFKDPIAPRSQKPKDKPKDGVNSPWDFTAPCYDERSSCFVNAGTDYGTGFNEPIGLDRASNKDPMPMKADTIIVRKPHK